MPFIWALCAVAFTLYASQAHSNPCSADVAIADAFPELANIRDHIEESPFMVACKDPPNLLEGRPRTGLFVRSVVEKDSRGLSTRDLLKMVVTRAKQRVSESKFQISNIRKCASDTSAKCDELRNWVDHELPKFVRDARFNLSLAQSQHEMKTWIGVASPKLNAALEPLGGYKFEDWAPLSSEEKSEASARLTHYKTKIAKDAQQKIQTHEICQSCGGQFSQETLLTLRFRHFQDYHQMLNELPLLQYLKGPSVTRADLEVAFTKMERGLANEDIRLDKIKKLLESNEPLNSDVLELLNYASLLEEVLLEDNRYCGLASALVYTSSNRIIGNSIAIGLPVLAASFYAAPAVIALGGTAAMGLAVGIGSGVVAGGAMAIHSFDDFTAARNRTLGHVYGDSLGADLKNLERKARRAQYDAVTLPVGFGLGGMALRSLTVSTKSYLASRKIQQSIDK